MIKNISIRALARVSTHAVRYTGAASFTLALIAAHTVYAANFSARGNEPGWHPEITEKAIIFQAQDGKTISIEPAPTALMTDVGQTYSAVVDGQTFTLTVADMACSDTMTGMPYPKTVSLVIGGRSLTGCGGDSASLLHGDWKIDAIGGKAVVEKSEPTLAFAPDGRIHGNGSCNRFFGGFKLSGEGLKLSETGASMMLCDQPLMDQERRLLTAFGAVVRFEMMSPTQLHLLGMDGVLISLRK